MLHVEKCKKKNYYNINERKVVIVYNDFDNQVYQTKYITCHCHNLQKRIWKKRKKKMNLKEYYKISRVFVRLLD